MVWTQVNSRDHGQARPFAQEIADLVRLHGGGETRIGVDRLAHIHAVALEAEGMTPVDVMGRILHTRRIKTAEEIACLQISMAATEAAVAAVERAIRPGASEQHLFGEMYGEVIRQGGEFIETRLLSSGPRTNPWFNEAGPRTVRPGELVALDTDTIGCNGYYSDFSRTFFCGPGRPSGSQKALYSMAWEQVQHNIGLLRPGLAYGSWPRRPGRIPGTVLRPALSLDSSTASACMARRRWSPIGATSTPIPPTACWSREWWSRSKAISASPAAPRASSWRRRC